MQYIRRIRVYISGIWGAKLYGRIEPKIFLEEGIRDVITCLKFGDHTFRGLASAEGQILPFPIDFDGRPHNTLTLPCERVISISVQSLHSSLFWLELTTTFRGLLSVLMQND